MQISAVDRGEQREGFAWDEIKEAISINFVN
jgi:hypothetical protein